MKIHIYILTVLFALTGISARAVTANEVLNKAAANISSAQSVSINFIVGKTNGNLTVGKEKFTFTSQGMSVWYDGKTQWALDKQAREVTITEPTAAELLESNPLKLVTSWSTNYTAKLLSAPSGQYKVELTAKRKGVAIRSAVVTVNAKTYVPKSIELNGSGGKTLFTISSFTKGKTLPASQFTYNGANNPGVTTNDLR